MCGGGEEREVGVGEGSAMEWRSGKGGKGVREGSKDKIRRDKVKVRGRVETLGIGEGRAREAWGGDGKGWGREV